jgi:hypothetical protein
MRLFVTGVVLTVSLGSVSIGFAQTLDANGERTTLSTAVGSGQMSPLVLSGIVGTQGGLVLGDAGYDTGQHGAIFDSAVEVRIWGPLALRADVSYADDTQRMRPAVGARLQLFRQAAHGVDGSLSSFFKTEGFDETEGEIETSFALGRRFSEFYLLGNVAYGQDPEGNERDGELRASALRSQGRFIVGAEARARSAIGPQHGTNSAVEPRFDAVGGPIAMVELRPFVLFGEIGRSAVQLAGKDVRWGIASLGGVGTIF